MITPTKAEEYRAVVQVARDWVGDREVRATLTRILEEFNAIDREHEKEGE